MNVRYRVELSQAERDELTAMLSGGKHAARKLKRAQILLAADAGVQRRGDCPDRGGAAAPPSYRTKRRFVEGNLERALSEEPRPGAERKLTGKEEALLVATACAKPARGPRPLDAGAAGRRDGQAHRSRQPVARDGAPAAGRERPQALAQGHVVHSPGRRRICRPHGRRARPLCRSARSQAAGGLLRREPGPAHRRGAPADPGRAGTARTLRLRVSPQRHRQSLRLPRRRIGPGARSRSPSGAPPKTTPNACANSSMSIIPTPRASGSCRTTCRPTRPAPSMRPSRPPRPGASCAASSSTTPPSTPAGSTWSRSRSACCSGQCLGPPHRRPKAPRQRNRRMGTAAKCNAGARIKWMFTTDKARAKMGRAYPDTSKES